MMKTKVQKRTVLLLLLAIACLAAMIVVVLRRGAGPPATLSEPEPRQSGLVAKLAFADNTGENSKDFKPSQPIVLDVLLKNYSEQPWSVDSRQMELPEAFVIKNSTGRVLRSITKITYPLYPVVERRFEPGDEYRFRVNLLELYPHVSNPGLDVLSLLTPDQYSVQAVIRNPVGQYSHQPADTELPVRLWPDDLISNVLSFKVRELSKREIKRELRRIGQLTEKERMKAIDRLGAVGAKEAVSELVKLASTDDSVDVRIAALLALGRIGDSSVVQQVESILLKDESSNVQAYAAGLLGQWRLKRSVPALIEALKNRKVVTPAANEEVGNVPYAAAIRALGDIGDPRATAILTEISQQDPVGWVRKAAAEQIRRIENSRD